MNQQKEFTDLLKRIRLAHQAFSRAWRDAKSKVLDSDSPSHHPKSPEQNWRANGIAYEVAQPLAETRDHLLTELVEQQLGLVEQAYRSGNPGVIDTMIDFLEVDVLAFRCGYIKERYLRMLKTASLNEEHNQRLRAYGLHLCSIPDHRREIVQAGRLMILIADRAYMIFVEI